MVRGKAVGFTNFSEFPQPEKRLEHDSHRSPIQPTSGEFAHGRGPPRFLCTVDCIHSLQRPALIWGYAMELTQWIVIFFIALAVLIMFNGPRS